MRHVAFTDARKRLFLDHFAGTCDAVASAEAAGVCKATVYKAAQRDRDFRAAWEEALAIGYAALEAEAVRQRLAMQRKMRDGLSPQGEIAQEFERVMKLLNRYDRRGGGVGFQRPRYGRMKSWSFEEAIVALDKKLQALGLRRDGTDGAARPEEGPGGAAGPGA